MISKSTSVKNEQQLIRLGTKHKGNYVEKSKILYIEAYQCYSWLYLIGGSKQLSTKPLGYYKKLLAEDSFLQIHRSYLINVSYIKNYEPNYRLVHLKNSITLSVSFRRTPHISKYLQRA